MVDVTATQRTIARQVSLADLPPEARPRALALAVAELIRSAGESPQPEAPPPAPVPTVAPERPLLLSGGTVAGEIRSHFSLHTALWGLRVGLMLSGRRWQISLDAGAATSRNEVNLGDLRILLAERDAVRRPALRPRARDRQRRTGRYVRLGADRGTVGHARGHRARSDRGW